MSRMILTAFALCAICLSPSTLLAQTQLEGEWKLVEIHAGRDATPAPEDASMTFAEGKMTPTTKGNSRKPADFSTNETVTPHTIDVIIPEGPDAGKTSLGIFQITGNKLTICMNISGGGERPAEFAPNPELRRVVMVLEKK